MIKNVSMLRNFGFPLLLLVLISRICIAQESRVLLKNGLAVGPGLRGQVARVDQNAFSSLPTEEISAKPIVVIDDGLRFTFINQNLVFPVDGQVESFQKIETGNVTLRATGGHQRIQGVQAAVSVTPFDPFGRRVYSLLTPNGQINVLQGITEISPSFIRVEGLKAEDTYIWDMRLALSAVPPDRLREILLNQIDQTKPQAWLDVVNLFRQSKRYRDARDFLQMAIYRHPELESQRPQLKQLDQLNAELMFEEVKIRNDAGQPKLALKLLSSFNADQVALETKLKVERRIKEFQETTDSVARIIEFLRKDAAAIDDEGTRAKLAPIIEEIATTLSASTLSRMADYSRLRDDKNLSGEQRIALGISGWLLGSGVAQDNLIIALSAWEARPLVAQYLASDSSAERKNTLELLKKLEAGTPEVVSKLIAVLRPPLPLPANASVLFKRKIEKMDVKKDAPDDAAEPAAVDEEFEEVEMGRYLIEVPNSQDAMMPATKYYIQLPPEYDPDRRYPAVVTLHSQFATAKKQMEWWTGPFNPDLKMCLGEASRHGYIVIAPLWAGPRQAGYNYTENEIARVLRSLRDAMRRTSIDSDRVYLSGHNMGGDAVWDITFAHPDMWAGSIAIGADCEKYPVQYRDNGRFVPLYFVVGELDGVPAPMARNGERLDDYLKSSKFDCMLTIYRGRGRDHFQEELPRIVEWMNLSSHRRLEPPREFDIWTSRAGDRSFWWLEIERLTSENIVNPLRFKPGKSKIEANLLAPGENGFRVANFPGKGFTIWMNRDLVDFSKKVNIFVKGKKRVLDVSPSTEILLEDARTRADRKHPYWARVDM